MSWITGKQPCEIGITENIKVDIRGKAPSIFRDIQSHGWHTKLIGKTHWTNHFDAYNLDFNKKLIGELGFNEVEEIAGPRALQRIECDLTREWEMEGYKELYIKDLGLRYNGKQKKSAWTPKQTILPLHLYPDIWLTNKAINSLRNLPISKNWILWVSFVGPHEPFDTPVPWKDIYADEEYRNRLEIREWMKKIPQCELRKSLAKWSSNNIDGSLLREIKRDYAAKVTMIDGCIRHIIDVAKTRCDYRDTGVLVTSDHGEQLGDYGMLYKGTFMESSVKVPFIYKEPEKYLPKQVRRSNKYLSSQKGIELIIDSLTEDASIKHISEEIGKLENGCRSYFKDETMHIYKGVKIVMDRDKNILWANDLKKKGEKEDIAWELNKNDRYKIALDWANKYRYKEISSIDRNRWFKFYS